MAIGRVAGALIVGLFCLMQGNPAGAQTLEDRGYRVEFQRGQSSATIQDRVTGAERVIYRLTASAGQTLEVKLSSNTRLVEFLLYGPSAWPNGRPLATSSIVGALVPELNRYVGRISASGDYRIVIRHLREVPSTGLQSAFFQRSRNQIIKHRLLRRIQRQAGNLARIVAVPGHFIRIATEILAKQISGDPVRIFAQDLMINVIKQLKLNGIAWPFRRLQTVDDGAAHAAHKVAIEKGNCNPQPADDLALPEPPGVFIQVAARYTATVVVEYMQIVAVGTLGIEESLQTGFLVRAHALHAPAKHSTRVIQLALRIAATGHIKHNAGLLFLRFSCVGELQSELCLADARGANHQRQRARQQAAPQMFIERGNSGRKSSHG